MNPIPTFILAKPRVRRRGRIGAPSSSPPPAALTLVGALYFEWDLKVQLTFDRAIDIASLDGTQVTLDDGVINGQRYRATGMATLADPVTVEIGLVAIATIGLGEILLTATAGTGIVAADDGGAWPGVTNVQVPF